MAVFGAMILALVFLFKSCSAASDLNADPPNAKGVARTSPANAASSNNLAPDAAADYVERVETYWLPQAQALPSAAPAGGDAYGALLTELEALRSYIADGERLTLTPPQRAIHRRFVSALSAKQQQLLPGFRRNYAELLRTQLFRREIVVSVSGRRADTLRLTGPLFSLNANVEDMQTELDPVLRRLRFRRVEYRWSRYVNDGYHYDLQPVPDAALSAP
jgi:hypothetical protein